MRLAIQNKKEIHFEELSDNDSAALIGGATTPLPFANILEETAKNLNLNKEQTDMLYAFPPPPSSIFEIPEYLKALRDYTDELGFRNLPKP